MNRQKYLRKMLVLWSEELLNAFNLIFLVENHLEITVILVTFIRNAGDFFFFYLRNQNSELIKELQFFDQFN